MPAMSEFQSHGSVCESMIRALWHLFVLSSWSAAFIVCPGFFFQIDYWGGIKSLFCQFKLYQLRKDQLEAPFCLYATYTWHLLSERGELYKFWTLLVDPILQRKIRDPSDGTKHFITPLKNKHQHVCIVINNFVICHIIYCRSPYWRFFFSKTPLRTS